jgi:hypothetical protein
MANVNSTAGFYNLPAQAITVNTEVALKVPASGYPSLPSPLLASGVGLPVIFPADIAGSMSNDGHSFVVRVAGKAHTAASYTLVVNLYQVPASIIAAGSQATVGNDHAVITNAASAGFSGDQNFLVEGRFIWDSVSGALNGFVTAAIVAGANVAPNSGTAGTLVVTSAQSSVKQADLNFMPTFTFGTANAANSITVTELVIDRD